MIATTRLEMNDLSRQKRLSTDLSDELTPEHTVEQAVQHDLERSGIHDNGLRWTAIGRGVCLDMKRHLSELPEDDTSWVVTPDVAAGGC